MPARTRLAICALTLHRPEGLRALLDGIATLDPPDGEPEIRVIIVDNDPEGSAASVVDEARGSVPWPIDYVVEPTRGIPFARNRAVLTAGDVDFVVFIDDDEVPDRPWLRELLRVQHQTQADVVEGPALPVYPDDAPRWIVDGGFFERARHASGSSVNFATTSNVLIRSEIFPTGGHPFNEAFGLNGGDDTHFFERARLEGRSMVWADDAVVRETVPLTRMTLRWLLKREYRRGNTLSLCLRDLNGSAFRRVRRFGQGIYRMLQGVLLLLAGLARGKAARAEGLRRIVFGVGLLTGLFGWNYSEYQVIHGA